MRVIYVPAAFDLFCLTGFYILWYAASQPLPALSWHRLEIAEVPKWQEGTGEIVVLSKRLRENIC